MALTWLQKCKTRFTAVERVVPMAKVVSVGEPVNESERLAIDFLRDHLPKRWRIFHNFMIQRDGTLFEVDIAILAPNVVYLVDIKGTRNAKKSTAALRKLCQHARAIIKNLIDSNPDIPAVRRLRVYAVVLLTACSSVAFARARANSQNITNLEHCVGYFYARNCVKKAVRGGQRGAGTAALYQRVADTIVKHGANRMQRSPRVQMPAV